MNLTTVYNIFVRDFRKQKKRITLTLVALGWGTISIMLLLGFGEGLHQQLSINRRGMGEAITQGAAQPFDRIYVSDQFFVPHTFILFYTRFPPEQYQKAPLLSIGQDQWDYSDFQIGRFRIHSPERVGEIPGEALYIIRSEDWVTLNDHASSAQILETVRDDLQRPLIYIVAIGGQSAPDETESQPVSDKKPAVLPESSIRQRIEEEPIDLDRARERTGRVSGGGRRPSRMR